jgi:hypothetical protein
MDGRTEDKERRWLFSEVRRNELFSIPRVLRLFADQSLFLFLFFSLIYFFYFKATIKIIFSSMFSIR